MPAFQPASSISGKLYNWLTFRERVLRRIGVPATRVDVEAAARGETGAAEWILAMLRQRAERGSVGERRAGGAAAGAGVSTPTRVVRKGGGGTDVVTSHSYAPSPLNDSGSNNCRGGWRAAALAARVGGGRNETPATAKAKTMMSRREPPPATRGPEEKRAPLLFSPAAPHVAPPPPSSAKKGTTAAAAIVRPASSSSPRLLELERESAALKSQIARLERLSLRQEAQIEGLLEALEDASATAAAAAAAAAAASEAPSPVAAVEHGDDDGPLQQQQQGILSSGSLKLPGGGNIGSSFPSSSPLRALKGAVLIGRC